MLRVREASRPRAAVFAEGRQPTVRTCADGPPVRRSQATPVWMTTAAVAVPARRLHEAGRRALWPGRSAVASVGSAHAAGGQIRRHHEGGTHARLAAAARADTGDRRD